MTIPGNQTSAWAATGSVPSFPPLERDLSVDVVIVGGGITGLTAALLLKQAGVKVALLEARQIGSGVSGKTTGHLTESLDTRYQTFIQEYGLDRARLIAEASRAAIERVAAFVTEEQINCDFLRVPGYLYTETDDQVEAITSEYDAARRLGIPITLVPETPLPFSVQAAARFDNQAQVHAMRYLQGLAGSVSGDGCHIFEQTRVMHITDGTPCSVQTEQGRQITATAVMLATHAPINSPAFLQELLPIIQTRIYPYRSYVLGIRLNQPTAPVGLFWDTASPYHYTRNFAGEESNLLIVGGADHKTGSINDTTEPYRNLETYAREHFDIAAVEYHWSSQVYEPADDLPFIGKTPLSRGVYVATGYSGNGMTYGTLAGMLLSDAFLNRPNAWSELYSPARLKPFTGAKEFISENIDVATHFVGDRVAGGTQEVADIPANAGSVVRIKGEQIAVYRDAQGQLHACSPVCTHAKCIVHWNTVEQSWDCPCHGGRFDAHGKVLHGPPVNNLEPKNPDW